MSKQLVQLLAAVPKNMLVGVSGESSVCISAPIVESDRELQAGGIFVARKGQTVDGHDFIPKAIERGAAAIVGEKTLTELAVPYVQVDDAAFATGYLAAAYYDFPSRYLTVVGVTGTNGKTTTTHLLHQILQGATHNKAGFISTIGADFGNRNVDTGLHVTTPTAPQVQYYLAQMLKAGLTHVVLEMTSHGLAQGRLVGVDVDVAILTNVTHEHLDYHGSWENYRAAKALMFRMLAKSQRKEGIPKISVVNADDSSHDFFMSIPADKKINYGIQQAAQYQAVDIRYEADGTYFRVNDTTFQTRLVGEFNVLNSLAAVAAARTIAIADEHIQAGLKQVEGISGRMQRIDAGQNFIAIVDFAHTPDALQQALQAGRTMLPAGKRLIAVFGSAGLRDVEKRRMMAEVSARLADLTILTAEDPRTESLDEILQMMAEGCESQDGIEGETFMRIPDRGAAIYRACQMAKAGDMVMVCGKGHEQSMCFGTIEYDWDDRAALRAALRGHPLRTLPTANW